MNNQTEIADLPRSYVEYRADFREPILEVWNYGEFHAAVFRDFRQWNIGLADITWNSNPTLGETVRARGFSIYTDGCVWVVDLSVLDPNALYVRLTRAFAPSVTIEQIAEALAADQAKLLEMLKLEIAENGE